MLNPSEFRGHARASRQKCAPAKAALVRTYGKVESRYGRDASPAACALSWIAITPPNR